MPNKKPVRIIFIGDVIGRPGRNFVSQALPLLIKKSLPDLVIANGENSAGGLGIIKKTAYELFDAGVGVITSGNHVWDKKEALELLNEEDQIIRPINYPRTNPGKGFTTFITDEGDEGVVVNLQGRVFLEPCVDNPFLAMDDFLETNSNKIVFVDFHAEATAEKQAMGFFLDGRVSAVIGTHTHVPTADLRIMPRGTAFQCDAGMTGTLESVIGMKKEPIVDKFLTGIHQRFIVDKGMQIMDVSIIDIDPVSGKALKTRSVRFYDNAYEEQIEKLDI